MKFQNKGETGIGTLIIFVAMILVAAIAAGVLLGTAGGLQQKALSVSKQATMDVSSGVQVVTMSGTNGTDGTVEAFEMLVKLTAGSDALQLNGTLVTLDTKTTSQNIRYAGIYGTATTGTETYSAEYIQNGTDHMNDYLTNGDIVKIRFNSTSNLTQSSTVKVRIVPKHGVIVPLDIVMPEVISTQRVMLYP
jgi:flagellin FlaB